MTNSFVENMKSNKDSVFQIRLSNDLRNAIHETSDYQGVSSSSLVRDLLIDNMKNNFPQVCSKYSI